MRSAAEAYGDDDADDRPTGLIARPGWAVAALLGLVLAVLVAWTQKPDPLPGRLSEHSWLEWLRYPVERNALLRLPAMPGTMLALHVQATDPEAKDQTLWVVGRGGSILISRNGGQSWEAQQSGTDSDLFSVHFDPQGQRGWVAGAGSTLLRTLDGGTTWKKIPPATLLGNTEAGQSRQVTLNSVQSLETNRQQVFVGSNRGHVFRSSDDGGTWQQVRLNPEKANRNGLRLDSKGQRGWSSGAGVLNWTVDGGKTWQQAEFVGELAAPVDAEVFELPGFAGDGERGWVVSRSGALFATSDGGRSWRLQKILTQAPASVTAAATAVTADTSPAETRPAVTEPRPLQPRSLHVDARGERLWLAAADGSIWLSTNGGSEWTQAAAEAKTSLRRIVMDEAGQRGWALGADGVILSTDDEGRTWAKRTQGASAVVLASHASEDRSQIWLAGHQGLLMTSTDRGGLWMPQDTGVTDNLHGLAFLPDKRRGWAVTQAGNVIATADGGRSWRAPVPVSKQRLRSVHVHEAPGSVLLWAAGDGGELWHSVDGGITWQQRPVARPAEKGETKTPGASFLLTSPIHRVRMSPDGRRGWAVAGRGWLAETVDAGATWRARRLKVGKDDHERPLRDIRFDKEGRWGLIVGDGGAIFVSKDSGLNWRMAASNTEVSLLTVDIPAKGDRSFVAGEGGLILSSKDNGDSWEPARQTVASARTTLAMDASGQTGWAFGYAPALLKTTNFGDSWESQRWPTRPERLPAPWFWFALVAVGAAVWQAFRPRPLASARGVEAMGTTDAPTEDFSRDRLQFAPLARGISRFLRNTRTEPPLTIAISGDWGSGKSSLMALMCADLRRYGSRPVWFNAWHHQSEEQILAALLTGIRNEGLPSMRSPDGWLFRLRLLWLRSRKHFVFSLLVLLALTVLISYLVRTRAEPGEWTNLVTWAGQLPATLDALAKNKPPPGMNATAVGALFSQMLAILVGVVGLQKGLKAFGADPSVLAARTAANFKMKDASAQTGFRARYAEQFDEVTQALPYRLVIVIDDLDRCRPEAVLSVMEAVNFLVSSGRCFVVFGMSTTRVEAALALAFEKIAKELVELDSALPANATAEQKERAERERRRAYVRDYLEKLINLEITVPQRTDLPPEQLLSQSTGQDTWALLRQALVFWPVVLAAAVVFVGVGVGRSDFGGLSAGAPAPKPAAMSAAPSTAGDGDEGGGGERSRQSSADAAAGTQATDAGRTARKADPAPTPRLSDARSLRGSNSTPSHWPLAAVFFAFVAVTGAVLVYRVRHSQRHVEDTQDFSDALRIWLPVVARRRSTPRLIKRFGNRLRYLAMLQQAELPEPPLRELLQQRWQQLTRAGRAALSQTRRAQRAAHPALAEHRLVALGALHHAFGPAWRLWLQPASTVDSIKPADAAGPDAGNDPAAHAGVRDAGSPNVVADEVAKAVAAYVKATQPDDWPPTADELALFDEALRGVRLSLAGDGLRTEPPRPS